MITQSQSFSLQRTSQQYLAILIFKHMIIVVPTICKRHGSLHLECLKLWITFWCLLCEFCCQQKMPIGALIWVCWRSNKINPQTKLSFCSFLYAHLSEFPHSRLLPGLWGGEEMPLNSHLEHKIVWSLQLKVQNQFSCQWIHLESVFGSRVWGQSIDPFQDLVGNWMASTLF